MNKIVLIGFAACGKSTVGKLLADKLGYTYVDTDSEIEKACKLTISEIFERYGEERFRKMENELLSSLVDTNAVVACGGGSVLAESFSQFANNSSVVWLTASARTVRSRLGNASRPLFDKLSEQELDGYISRRSKLYERYATLRVSTDSKTPEQVAAEIYNYVTTKQ